jgi:hypothetical protein
MKVEPFLEKNMVFNSYYIQFKLFWLQEEEPSGASLAIVVIISKL